MFIRKNFYKLISFFTLLFIVLIATYVYATDYSVTSSTTTKISLADNDTLTVSNAGSINRTGTRAVDGGWRTFSSSSTTITKAGTITASSGQTIYAYDATNFSLNNSGTISTPSGEAYNVYLPSSNGTTTIINSGTISSGDWNSLDVSAGADVTITNSGTISATSYQAIRANGAS